MSASENQMAHRRRKREAGDCMYGGCHRPWVRAGFCAKHHASTSEQKAMLKVRKLTLAKLVELRDWHESVLRRICVVLLRGCHGEVLPL